MLTKIKLSLGRAGLLVLLLAPLSEPLVYSQAKNNKSDPCACRKSVEKFLEIEKTIKERKSSFRRAYRGNKALTVTQKLIDDVLRCECAREGGRQRSSGLARKEVALLAPVEARDDCQLLVELNHEFTEPMDFKKASTIFRNVASDMGADTIVISAFERKKGARYKIMKCNNIAEGIFLDPQFKRYREHVFDPSTALTWQRCSLGQKTVAYSCVGKPLESSLSAAKDYCASLPFFRGKRWRLPETEELHSLVRLGGDLRKAKIDLVFFPTTPPEVYWGNTPYWTDKAAQVVDFESGKKIAYDIKKKGYTRCVIDLIPEK